eukprot:14165311-Alexandrium_andersonii.AAC.1
MTLRALREGRGLPEHEEEQWPGGTWACGLCGHKNGPKEFFCQAIGDGHAWCKGCQNDPSSKIVVWLAKPRRKSHRPPSHLYRWHTRKHDALSRQRKAKRERRSEKHLADVAHANWTCTNPECGVKNQIRRGDCYACSRVPDWENAVFHNREAWDAMSREER